MGENLNTSSPEGSDIFQFFASSSSAPAPGKGTGESLESPARYNELKAVKGWRALLSNEAVTPFTWKGKRWNTVEHAYQASKFEEIRPDVFDTFSLDSGSELSKAGGDAAKAQRNIIMLNKAGRDAFQARSSALLQELWRAKFSLPEPKRVLLLTGNAQLWHATPKAAKERWIGLEELRTSLAADQMADLSPEPNAVAATAPAAAPAAAPAPKKTARKKAAPAPAPASAAALPEVNSPAVGAVPEGSLAAGVAPVALPDPDLPEQKESGIRFCVKCNNYLYLQVDVIDGETDAEQKQRIEAGGKTNNLSRICRNCGFKDTTSQSGLVSEIMVQERSAEGYNMINEFTLRDPRLPHLHKTMKCVNDVCISNTGGAESDVVYIKYDLANLRYIYMCYHCETVWRSRR